MGKAMISQLPGSQIRLRDPCYSGLPTLRHGLKAAFMSMAPKSSPITSKAQMIEHLASGSKPRPDWRIGT